ncbi:MAG: type II toxin-antitoxin system VapC family toxin [Candidatus Limnocylindrales bacterium]
MLVYADASALVKLIVEETESAALRLYLGADATLTSSRVSVVELSRAIRRNRLAMLVDPEPLLASVGLIELEATVSRRAGEAPPASLRSLDAIHLASALALHAQLDAFVTYDLRLAEAARTCQLPVVSPA